MPAQHRLYKRTGLMNLRGKKMYFFKKKKNKFEKEINYKCRQNSAKKLHKDKLNQYLFDKRVSFQVGPFTFSHLFHVPHAVKFRYHQNVLRDFHYL